MFYRLNLITTLCLVLFVSTSVFARNNQKQLITSYNFNYQIALHIKKRTLYVDRVPDNFYYSKYKVGVKQPYELDQNPEITSGYDPFNAPWISEVYALRGELPYLSLRSLEDGVYTIMVYAKKEGTKYLYAQTDLYSVPIQVKGKDITFVQSPHHARNKAILEKIPTSDSFLKVSLKSTSKVPVDSPSVQQIVQQLSLSSSSDDITVERIVNWIASNLYYDTSTRPLAYREVDVESILKTRKLHDYGYSLVGMTLFRAAGIPCVLLPVEELKWNSPWWNAGPGVQTYKHTILLAYYGDKWRMIDPRKNSNGENSKNGLVTRRESLIAHKGVDMSLSYVSNRMKLLYEGELKFMAESDGKSLDLMTMQVASMPVDSIDSLGLKNHFMTSYCSAYSIGLQIEDNVFSSTALPKEENLSDWRAYLYGQDKKAAFKSVGSMYDHVEWDMYSCTPGNYYYCMSDKNRDWYMGAQLIPVQVTDKDAFFVPPVDLEWNKHVLDTIQMTPNVREELLESTDKYPAADSLVVSLAKTITTGLADDYQKLAAIHRWVSTNIHYDRDSYYAQKKKPEDNMVLTVLKRKRAVCSGYTRVACALMRAVGIPAVGLRCTTIKKSDPSLKKMPKSSGHIFPIAYCNNRWVLMDPTWDSKNIYLDGLYTRSQKTPGNMLYFDATVNFMSQSRRFKKLYLHTYRVEAWEKYVDKHKRRLKQSKATRRQYHKPRAKSSTKKRTVRL